MFTTIIAAAALLVAGMLIAPAQAASGDTKFSPDGAERECVFVAEIGGYQCESFDAGGSLTGLGDRNAKKKLSIQLNPAIVNINLNP